MKRLPTFALFASHWVEMKRPEWHPSVLEITQCLLSAQILPFLGRVAIDKVDRAALFELRSRLSKPYTRADGRKVTRQNVTINRYMSIVAQILTEAELQFGIQNPAKNFKKLKLGRKRIDPLTLDEVMRIIENVPEDYRHYTQVRFFSGLRPGELCALRWCCVDFNRRQLLVRASLSKGRLGKPKTAGSEREVDLMEPAWQALQALWSACGKTPDREAYVLVGPRGRPIDTHNYNNRVFRPVLRRLGIKERRAYQTRHSYASLMLAAGESPEWVSVQLGHRNTAMLHEVYGRFVQSPTRRDGSAFNAIVTKAVQQHPNGTTPSGARRAV